MPSAPLDLGLARYCQPDPCLRGQKAARARTKHLVVETLSVSAQASAHGDYVRKDGREELKVCRRLHYRIRNGLGGTDDVSFHFKQPCSRAFLSTSHGRCNGRLGQADLQTLLRPSSSLQHARNVFSSIARQFCMQGHRGIEDIIRTAALLMNVLRITSG